MRCADCKFWRRKENASVAEAGACHRRSPSPVGEAALAVLGTLRARGVLFELTPDEREKGAPSAQGGDLWDRRALWPTTLEDDFCGEFAPDQPARQSFV